MKKNVLLGVIGCLALTSSASCDELVLVEDGKTDYRIVVAMDASMQDLHAARQLQRYVAEITGVDLQIVSDENALGDREVVVGFNRHADCIDPALRHESFGPEAFRIRTYGARLVIVGGSPRGVLYGVNTLLTDEFNCRWFTPSLRRIPKVERLVLPPINRHYEPAFDWRDTFFWSGMDNEWSFYNCVNKNFTKPSLGPEQGWRAGYSHSWQQHTALMLVPPEKYLENHRNYFWTGEGDQPRSGRTTRENRKGWTGICLSHPDVAKIAAQTLLDTRRQLSEGDVWYSISQMDYDDWCECERCQQMHVSVGGDAMTGGGAAWLHFAAKVHTLLEDEPDAPKIGILAYGYTPIPPTVPVRHEELNVFYAEITACQFHSLDDPDCPNNQNYRKRLAGWLRSAGSVYVWLYKMNFDNWFFVHPNMTTFADDMRYLRQVGVKGVFCQGTQNAWWGHRFGGEMNELRSYLLARLMWNPDLDWREERREFCAAYYGEEAGRVIEAYLDDVSTAFQKQGVHGGLGSVDYSWIAPEMISRWYAYMDKAESLAGNDEMKKLVRISRLPIQFTEANITKDPHQRQGRLEAYLRSAQQLVGNVVMTEGMDHYVWAQSVGLKW